MSEPNYWPKWTPTLRKPWRIVNLNTGHLVRDDEGRALTFGDGPWLWEKVKQLEKQLSGPRAVGG